MKQVNLQEFYPEIYGELSEEEDKMTYSEFQAKMAEEGLKEAARIERMFAARDEFDAAVDLRADPGVIDEIMDEFDNLFDNIRLKM
jgi:hypothetical protein